LFLSLFYCSQNGWIKNAYLSAIKKEEELNKNDFTLKVKCDFCMALKQDVENENNSLICGKNSAVQVSFSIQSCYFRSGIYRKENAFGKERISHMMN